MQVSQGVLLISVAIINPFLSTRLPAERIENLMNQMNSGAASLQLSIS